MKEIVDYLNQKKRSYKEGFELLLKHDKKLDAKYRDFFEKNLKKEKPDTIAVQMLESRLRDIVRIAAQKKTGKSEQSTETMKAPEKPKNPQLPTNPDTPKLPENPEDDPELTDNPNDNPNDNPDDDTEKTEEKPKGKGKGKK